MAHWRTAAEVYAAKARFEAAIPGWEPPAAYALGVQAADGTVSWRVRNHPNVHQLPGVVLATVLGHRNGTATYVLDDAAFARAIALLEPAGACEAFEHPNLWAWQSLHGERARGEGAAGRIVVAFVVDVDDPVVDVVDAQLRPHLAHETTERAGSPLPRIITGPDITLRAWAPIEAAVLHDLVVANLDHLRPWMPWTVDEPLALDERAALIDGWQQRRLAGGDAVYAIVLHDRPVGACGLHRRGARSGLEIGYWLAAAHTGRGIATEAARLLTETALGTEGITHVEIHHDRANLRSEGIPRRLGYDRIDERPSVVQRAPHGEGITVVWRTARAG